MDNLDAIKAKIQKAQAEAIRKADSLSAASSDAIIKGSQEILKRNITESSKKNDTKMVNFSDQGGNGGNTLRLSTGGGVSGNGSTLRPGSDGMVRGGGGGSFGTPTSTVTSAAQQMPTDTRTTQQKYEDAASEYEKYIGSDEYRQDQEEKKQEALSNAKNFPAAEVPRNPVYVAQLDSKGKELKAARDYYRQQMEAEENQRIMEADMNELALWPDEDRAALEEYVRQRDERDDPFTVSNPLRFISQTFNTKKTYSALEKKYGKELVKNLAESYGKILHEQDAQKLVEDTAKAVDSVPGAIGHNILSIGANALGGTLGMLGRANESFNRTGRYSTLETYTPGDALSLYASTVRSATAQNIEGKDGSTGRKLLSFGYQGVMSAADSLTRAVVGGKVGSLALAATGSFSQTMSAASKQGATPEQALILSIGSAALETATEYIPLDELLKAAKGGTKAALAIAGEALKQAGIEATTEEISLFGNLLLEAAVLQDKSSYNQTINELVAGGASYDEAKAQADKDVWDEVLETAAVSGFSGGLSGGASAYYGSLTAQSGPETAQALGVQPEAQSASATDGAQQAQQTLEAVGAEFAQKEQQIPKPEIPQRTLGQQQMEAGIAQTLGVEPSGPEIIKQTSERQGQLSELVNGRNQQAQQNGQPTQANTDAEIDIGSDGKYNTIRSLQAQDAIDRLNIGGQEAPSIEEIMSIPEIAEAERANDGPETITLPNREKIQESGYRQAMEKGSWDGQDYSGEVRQERRMDIVIGLPGSGKSSVYTERLSQEHKSRVIDTDDFRTYIPEYNGSNAAVVHEEASAIKDQALRTAVYNGDNILLSTIGANAENLAAQIAGYKEAGYQVYLHLNELPNNKSLARAIGRYVSEDGTLGRYVSPQLIAAYGDKPTQTYLYLTGQGGNQNGELEGSLRAGRGQYAEDAARTNGTNEGRTGAEGATDLLAGYDWYNNDVARGEPPRLIQSSDSGANAQQPQGAAQNPDAADTGGSIPGRGESGAMGADSPQQELIPAPTKELGPVTGPEGRTGADVKQSNVYTNTYANTPYGDIRNIGQAAQAANPDIAQYEVNHEADSLREAARRTETEAGRGLAHRDLMEKGGWDGVDNDTAMSLLASYMREGKKDLLRELSGKQRQMATQSGQMAQSFAKYSRKDASVAVADAIAELDRLKPYQVDKNRWVQGNQPKRIFDATTDTTADAIHDIQGTPDTPHIPNTPDTASDDAFHKWKEGIADSLIDIGNEIESVEDGDIDAMKDIVRQLANYRKTTAWFGLSSDLERRTERGLSKMDFDTLKTVATTQMSMISNDNRKRSKGEYLKAFRIQNMLSSVSSVLTNHAGNISNGLMDALSDSFGGRMIDTIISKWTGQRTVGNDIKYAKEYSKAARDAADVAAAFVSLDIPIDLESKYSYGTRTFTPNTKNVIVRMLSAYEKHMKYALEVSDKFYESGASHVVKKSIEGLGAKSGLTAEQIQSLAEKTGQRRTFKDPGASVDKNGKAREGRMLADTSAGIKKGLNRMGTNDFGAGDLIMPFARVPAELAQVGIDYTGGGMITGLQEIISIAQDVRRGNEIDPYRQRKAAMDFGRGMATVPMIALFAKMAEYGCIKIFDPKDNDERKMGLAQGKSGIQLNFNSMLRAIQGVATFQDEEEIKRNCEWREDDTPVSLSGLEQLNAQMYMGYYLSQGVSIPTAFLRGNVEAIKELPPLQTLTELYNLQKDYEDLSDVDMGSVYNSAGKVASIAAGSIIPNFVRKAAQTIDPIYRDTYDTDPFKKIGKQLVSALPGLSTRLPAKYDNLGNVQRRYEEGDWIRGVFNKNISPFEIGKYKPTEIYQEIERLNSIEGVDITPPSAKRKFTYTDNKGKKHENYQLSGKEYETMQQVQGQTASQLLDEMITNPAYGQLSDEQKTKAIKEAYSYAEEQAKREILPDYYSKADAWMDDISDDAANGLIRRAALSPIKKAVGDTITALKNDWELPESKQELDSLYSTYDSLSQEEKQQILDNAVGETAKYLEMRSHGISTERYMDVTEDIKKLSAESGYSGVRDIQKYEAITGKDELSDKQKDIILRAYMPDYNPEARSPKTTEVKYDAIRELGISPEDYTNAYRIYNTVKGKDKRDRTIKQYVDAFKCEKSTAEQIYDILAGKSKPWEE